MLFKSEEDKEIDDYTENLYAKCLNLKVDNYKLKNKWKNFKILHENLIILKLLNKVLFAIAIVSCFIFYHLLFVG